MNKELNSIRNKARRHRTLIQNFSYLSSLQVFNLLIPLITYPYLIRTLGSEYFGLIFFAQAVIGYLMILVSFGFNLSATKEISIHRNDKVKLNEIFNSVIIIKALLFILSFFVLAIILTMLEEAKGFKLLFYLTMWRCLYEFIFPLWYFQGIEKMKYITIITLISRLTFLGLIFLFIHSSEDYLLVPVMYGIGSVVSGITALIIVRNHGIRFEWQPLERLIYYFKDSLPLFISNLSTSLAINTNKVILGIVSGMQEVALYELAEKLSLIMKTPIQLIGQAIYPKVSQQREKGFLRKTFFLAFLISLSILSIGWIFSDLFITLFGGEGMRETIPVFRILLLTLLPVTVSLFFANIALISWGFNKTFLRVRVYNNLFYAGLIVILVLTDSINLKNLAYTILAVEIFAAVASYFYCNLLKINFLKG